MPICAGATTSKETLIGMTTATRTGSANDSHAATLATLARVCGAGAFDTSRFRDNLRLFVPRERLLEVLGVLKGECGFGLLAELGGADYLGYPGTSRARFEVHYVLLNLDTSERLVVKAGVDEPDPRSPLSSASGRGPTGWNARSTTCMASSSAVIPTCGGS